MRTKTSRALSELLRQQCVNSNITFWENTTTNDNNISVRASVIYMSWLSDGHL